MPKLVIYGAGTTARIAHHYFSCDSDYGVVAFAADTAYLDADTFCGLPLLDSALLEARYPPSEASVFVAIGYTGMNQGRADVYQKVKSLGYQCPTYVSSRCTMLTSEPVGDNCLILEDNTIQPFVRIGNNVTLWSGNHIGHDSQIGDHCFIASHVVVSGFCRIEPYCFIGVNATIADHLTIGEKTLVGSGAVITHDTEPLGTYVAPRARKAPRPSTYFM